MESEKKKRGLVISGTALITAGAVVMICALVFYCFGARIVKTYFGFEPEQKTGSVIEANAASAIAIPGFESAEIAADAREVALKLYNPETNDCYFEIAIELTQEGREIYRSKLISPGQTLETLALNEPVPAGSYDAALHYYPFSTDGTYTPLNGADVPFTLNVK